ncbi:glycosyltransferase family 4 protein [Caulobacter segnis]|uniref:glycosyltransferase family 4 protein n=1 Tax=Caulobacter segnis TaxID=88688 RepID=UPI00240F72DF|nr:glycosyltransferase family 4 protein [Caulobacter segnis]MDG2521854.1 glycosyltransferase family 4 protein [Caulobacter segnis]
MDLTLASLGQVDQSDATELSTPVSAGADLKRVALIGNFPPRRCGIATFTADVHDALTASFPDLACDVYAMDDGNGPYDFGGPVKFSIRQQQFGDYAEAARRINESGADLINLQHEFGIFGGPAGEDILRVLSAVRAPVVVTLHTVLTNPNADQRRVMRGLIQRASRLLVMAEKGKEILRRVYSVPGDKIAVIPHGAPDRPLVEPDTGKAAFGLEGRKVLMTFGLLSPNKGLEVMIRALPAIVERHPDVIYTIIGATHPHLIAREGEAYREQLAELATSLGVRRNLAFINEYMDTPALLDRLQAADIYVTPYLAEAQITSGTLSYAVAMGKAVVSTPYWHAHELLNDGTGVLAPFGDVEALAAAVNGLLDDPERQAGLQARAYAKGRRTIWSAVAKDYVSTFKDAQTARVIDMSQESRARLPAPKLDAVERLTDACGIFQHSLYGVPDRRHGYCIDDNARGLILATQLKALSPRDERPQRLAWVYASFVQYAWNADVGRFRNFMSYERTWLEAEGSSDSGARALWAIGATAENAPIPDLRHWAEGLVRNVLPSFEGILAARTSAFAILGLASLVRCGVESATAERLLRKHADHLAELFETHATADWTWFEPFLSYDNARLPEALLRAGMALEEDRYIQIGLKGLAWLCEIQSAPDGCFRPVGTHSFGVHHARPSAFDQQPLEAAATIDACAAAFEAAGEQRWVNEARRAYDWYLGANDLGVRMARDEDGSCLDGLSPQGPNLNQGAESVLAFQMSTCAMHSLLARHSVSTPLAVRH